MILRGERLSKCLQLFSAGYINDKLYRMAARSNPTHFPYIHNNFNYLQLCICVSIFPPFLISSSSLSFPSLLHPSPVVLPIFSACPLIDSEAAAAGHLAIAKTQHKPQTCGCMCLQCVSVCLTLYAPTDFYLLPADAAVLDHTK